MVIGARAGKRRRGLWGPRLFVVAMTAVLAGSLGGVSASATTVGSSGNGSQVVDVTINVAALPLTNLCNADVVVVNGEMRIVTVTTPDRRGGFTVRSTATAKNLTGNRIAPPPPIGYRADQRENSYSYYAPPPYPSTSRVLHYTKLVPQGKAPTMYLVVVLRYTIAADGTLVPVAERAYLVCQPPSSGGGGGDDDDDDD